MRLLLILFRKVTAVIVDESLNILPRQEDECVVTRYGLRVEALRDIHFLH
jgi:hypothetical protein